MEQPVKRRGPGRPSNKPPMPPVTKNGIVEAPKDSANAIEFVTVFPSYFKSLFVYFKNLKSRSIHVRFSKTDITFLTRDHTSTSRVIAIIDCKHVNWYYCRQEVCLGLNREHSEKMFTNIDKTFFKLSIEFREEDKEFLWFIFRDQDMVKECQYKIAVENIAPDPELFELEREIMSEEGGDMSLFPLQFTMSSRQFKKTISDASSYSETITIEKYMDSPLQIKYDDYNIVYNEVYLDDQKIKLISNVNIFTCRVKVPNIKSLASSIVTDNVTIMCREDNDILLRSDIDEKSMVVYTFVKCCD